MPPTLSLNEKNSSNPSKRHQTFLALNSLKLKLTSFSPMLGVGSASRSHGFTANSSSFPFCSAFSDSAASPEPNRNPFTTGVRLPLAYRFSCARVSSGRSKKKSVSWLMQDRGVGSDKPSQKLEATPIISSKCASSLHVISRCALLFSWCQKKRWRRLMVPAADNTVQPTCVPDRLLTTSPV